MTVNLPETAEYDKKAKVALIAILEIMYVFTSWGQFRVKMSKLRGNTWKIIDDIYVLLFTQTTSKKIINGIAE